MIVRLAEENLRTRYGKFHEVLYYDGQKESIVMVMGKVKGEDDILCRVHSSCLHGHVFNSVECDCREQMEISQQLIQKEGRGIIIWLEQEGKGNGHYALLKSLKHKRSGMPQSKAYEAVGFKADARDFRAAAEILQDLGVISIILLTNNPEKSKTINDFGIKVNGIQKTE